MSVLCRRYHVSLIAPGSLQALVELYIYTIAEIKKVRPDLTHFAAAVREGIWVWWWISSYMFLTERVPYAGPGAPVVLLFLLSGPENSEELHSKVPCLTLIFATLKLSHALEPGAGTWRLGSR